MKSGQKSRWLCYRDLRLVLACLVSGLVIAVNVYAQPELRDPTRPYAEQLSFSAERPVDGDQPWVLNSTLVAPDRRTAVINGTLVSEGDWLGRARVVSVEHNKVKIESGGRRITLRLIPESIKRRRQAQ